jgi:hypothetical protein
VRVISCNYLYGKLPRRSYLILLSYREKLSYRSNIVLKSVCIRKKDRVIVLPYKIFHDQIFITYLPMVICIYIFQKPHHRNVNFPKYSHTFVHNRFQSSPKNICFHNSHQSSPQNMCIVLKIK